MLNIVYLSYMEIIYSLYNVGYSKYIQLSMKKLFTHSIFRKVLGGTVITKSTFGHEVASITFCNKVDLRTFVTKCVI
jgi:hypothetical protein